MNVKFIEYNCKRIKKFVFNFFVIVYVKSILKEWCDILFIHR